MRFNSNVFYGDDGDVLLAEQVLENALEVEKRFQDLELSQSYWSVACGLIDSAVSNELAILSIELSYKSKRKSVELPINDFPDYFIVDDLFIPIRKSDWKALQTLAFALKSSGSRIKTISDLIQVEYQCAISDLEFLGQSKKDELLSSQSPPASTNPKLLTVTPYPYQEIGIQWLLAQQALGKSGAILADVMGLGKTLQAIGLISINVNNGNLNNLIICPSTLVENWRRELNKFAPHLDILVHSGPMRAGTAARVVGHDVVVTSFDALVKDHALLSTLNWNIVVIDEAQFIKNPAAQRTRRSKGLPRKFGLAVSGTPLENRLLDLWSLTDFASPGLLGGEVEFQNRYEAVSDGGIALNHQIKPIMLRRKLDDIEHQLPEKVVQDHPLIWPVEMNRIYENIRREAIAEFGRAGGLVATTRLRKLTTHPRLMEIGPRDLSAASPKYVRTLEILEELFANNEKCLIFSSYTEMIDLITDDIRMKYPDAFVANLDGRVPMENRSPLVDEFNGFSGYGILVCNPIVAGAGLTLTGANHVIHYNLEWNPAKEDQATFRIYRNGQKKVSFIHRLYYVNTIDEVIDQRIQLKRGLADLTIDASISNEDFIAGLQISPFKDEDDGFEPDNMNEN